YKRKIAMTIQSVTSDHHQNLSLAIAILGKDFLTPWHVMAILAGIIYTADECAELIKSLPGKSELESIRDAGMFLFPGPPTAMSLVDIRALNPDYFDWGGPGEYPCPEGDDPDKILELFNAIDPLNGDQFIYDD